MLSAVRPAPHMAADPVFGSPVTHAGTPHTARECWSTCRAGNVSASQQNQESLPLGSPSATCLSHLILEEIDGSTQSPLLVCCVGAVTMLS
jgi:hypothetical protein